MWRTSSLVGALIAAIACSAAFAATAGSPASVAANRAVARATAARLFDATPLPAGAVATSGWVGGSSPVGGAPASPDLATYDRDYRVPGRWRALFAQVQASPPPGTVQDGSGSSGTSAGTTSRFAAFALEHLPAGVYQAGVDVSLAAATGGGAALHVDAWAVWLVPRPAWERVPRSSRTVRVFADVPAGTRFTVATITSRRTVRALVRFVNGLQRFQPGLLSCPVIRGPLYGLTFLAAGGSRVLARTADTGCGGMSFWLRSRRGPPLADDLGLSALLRRLHVLPVSKAGGTDTSPPRRSSRLKR